VTEAQLAASCNHGTPIAAAAKYSGTSHPLALLEAETGWSLTGYVINGTWNSAYGGTYDHGFPAALQLVACQGAQKTVRVGSCGDYRDSYGYTGEVIRYKYTVNVRIIVARTGKSLKSKNFSGSVLKCSDSFTIYSSDPPWKIYGTDPSSDAIDSYIYGATK
jgi:hypothetical protein